MSKLYIARNKYGKYYTKFKTKNGNTKMLSVNLPYGTELNQDFGTFECTYEVVAYDSSKTNDAELAIKVLSLHQNYVPDYMAQKPEQNPYEEYNDGDAVGTVSDIETPF